MFLALSYFGTDQSQVQRYLAALPAREPARAHVQRRLQDPDAVLHPPAGVLIFVFYQFERPPVFFNQAAWSLPGRRGSGGSCGPGADFTPGARGRARQIEAWLGARHAGDAAAEAAARRPPPWRQQSRVEAAGIRTTGGLARPTPGREGERLRLCLHHLHPGPPAARPDRPAGDGVLRRGPLLQGGRAERARLDDDRRHLPPSREAGGLRRALRHGLEVSSPRSGAWWPSASPSSPTLPRT
jgi:hypothetical protein